MRMPGGIGTRLCGFVVVLRLVLLTLVLASAASVHGRPGPAGQRPEAVGQYFLVSANGQELPAVVSESEASRQEVAGGSIILEADGGFVWSTDYRNTEHGVVDVSESSGRGAYSQQGARIVLMFEPGADGCCEGYLDGNTLTIQEDVAMVYRRLFGQRPTQASTAPGHVGLLSVPASQPPNRITFALPLAPGSLPRSFEDLCDSSTVIADAYVQSVLTPRQGVRNLSGIQVLPEGSFPIFRFLETDSILRISRVFKGPESIRQAVISQKGGVLGSYTELPTQYDLMQQGERYILFLINEEQTDLPDVPGITRYGLNGSWTGMFRIDAGGVHVSRDAADVIRKRFGDRDAQDLITEIQRCSYTPPR